MSILGVNIKENTFYCTYSDDCWIVLAQEIMSSYSIRYVNAIPTTAISQAEYDKLNETSYAPIRRSILRNIKYGPLRNAVNIVSVYDALEARRKENLFRLGINWKDTYNEDVTKI